MWLGARHLALNADEQLQLRQLNGKYDSIGLKNTQLSLQMSMSILAVMILAKIRGSIFCSLIRSNRMVTIMITLCGIAFVGSCSQLHETQMKIDYLTLLITRTLTI